MADSPPRRGKLTSLFTVLLIFSDLFCFPCFPCLVLASEAHPSSISNPVIETDDETEIKSPNSDLIRKQQLQLEKLEGLVENLNQLVARLEPQFAEGNVKVKTLDVSSSDGGIKDVGGDDRLPGKQGVRERAGAGAGAEPVLVTKYNAVWSERFQFVSAVKLSSRPTCINVFPYRDLEGLRKYFAVGDDEGKLYVFLRSGDVALEFDTFLDGEERASVTSMVSYMSIYKNESMVVTGHANGVVVMHRVWEVSTGDEWSSLHVERVGRFEMLEAKGLRINLLEVHHVGRKRYILAMDGGGTIIVFKEDRAVHGAVKPNRRPIAFMKHRLLFLTENGAGSLDLRTMKLKESECEGWNGSFATSYAFDAMDRSKAYGITSEGDLIQTFLLGDTMNFMCRVRSKRKLDMDEPVALHAIKGYLLIANQEKAFVYNISSQQYVRGGGLRLMFSAGLDEIVVSFLNQRWVDGETRTSVPLIASDYEKHVLVSFGNGYVALYRSNLPVLKNEFNSILWSSPVLFFIIFLFAAWHFFANKKEALTAWGPDVPFSSSPVSSGAPLGSNTGDRSFADSSRNPEILELRGSSGLRGSSRYGSPPRYQGGAGNSYAPGPEPDSRPAPMDPRFRPGSELKYRGPNVETGDVPKRRDALFVSGQVADDGN